MTALAAQLDRAEKELSRAKAHSYLAGQRSARVIQEYLDGLLIGRASSDELRDALVCSKQARIRAQHAADEVARLRKLLEDTK